jgi:hypothetical protein
MLSLRTREQLQETSDDLANNKKWRSATPAAWGVGGSQKPLNAESASPKRMPGARRAGPGPSGGWLGRALETAVAMSRLRLRSVSHINGALVKPVGHA